MPPNPPLGHNWTAAEIAADCAAAKTDFRVRRLSVPLQDYLAEFPSARAAADHIITNLSAILASPANGVLLADVVADPAKFIALRYSAAVPISEDDLATLIGSKPSSSSLRRNQEQADALATLLRDSLDPKRFPWVAKGFTPTQPEIEAAGLSSAVAATIQRVQTKRRGDEKAALEDEIEAVLIAAGFTLVPTPKQNIIVLSAGPTPGTYMRHCNLGNDNADFVIGLHNRRLLALEAKASNSEINSRKRLNKEVVQDAQQWARTFGAQVVAAAGLRGVFKPTYVGEAQNTPLLIFWGHRLSDLTDYLVAAV